MKIVREKNQHKTEFKNLKIDMKIVEYQINMKMGISNQHENGDIKSE